MYYDIIGIAGATCYLSAYFLLQSKKLDAQKGYSYNLLKIIGAILVLISLKNVFNLPSAISQSVWILLSCYGLLRVKSVRNTGKNKDPRAQIIYNSEILGQTNEVYVDGRLAWSRTNRSVCGRR